MCVCGWAGGCIRAYMFMRACGGLITAEGWIRDEGRCRRGRERGSGKGLTREGVVGVKRGARGRGSERAMV